ncbi:MAG TPA: DUF4232 domain-containing protein [Caulobacteraceae bacterium]|jgi:hypothetical protein|nr:DUF4232 domain-containing protein [Caulobacteraceae bacterium]
MRRTVLALGVAGGLALAGCHQQDGGGNVRADKAPPCRSQDLALKRAAEDASVGLVTYRFVNHSERLCSLKGYPEITLSGADGAKLDAKIQQFEPPPTMSRRGIGLVLRPGASADFSVVFPKDAGKGVCKPFVKLTATPPGSDWGLDSAEDRKLCEGPLVVSIFTVDPGDL